MNEISPAVLPFDVPRETLGRLHSYLALLLDETQRQNLIARSTAAGAWQRHIVDSAQLLPLAPVEYSNWLDVGSGAGLPGMVVSILTSRPVTLVEPRRLRAAFLHRCTEELGLRNVTVFEGRAEKLTGEFDVISARAVASVADLFTIGRHLAHSGTRWILPRGRSGAKELAEAEASWQGHFGLEPSITAEDAMIVLAEGVAPRGRTRGRA
ncbi:16S rRNA (guanine(527)-N(7))-methyltransferase RsmG [Sphingomonas arenae]|uniref:16S rRNA (guanine(527)-N(7))-methyltransferase RsmG n=1 Tax=Sphingomonas arenae TaxID=2812555 RepID=UPI0019671DE6|nr:16S rRNA (guanine(527)-N(7))-methyltransferase RsmG [Sphingomonas arenae]